MTCPCVGVLPRCLKTIKPDFCATSYYAWPLMVASCSQDDRAASPASQPHLTGLSMHATPDELAPAAAGAICPMRPAVPRNNQRVSDMSIRLSKTQCIVHTAAQIDTQRASDPSPVGNLHWQRVSCFPLR